MEKKDIFELMDNGSINCKYQGNGNPTGNIGKLILKNNTDKDYEVNVPRGTIFAPVGKGFQTMTTGSPMTVPLLGNETRSEEIEDGFCNDEYTKPPPDASAGESDVFLPDKGNRINDIVENVEKNLEKGKYGATRLMRKPKARQTLIQWTLWRTANPKTFNKDTAKKIIYGQYEEREKRPEEDVIDKGVDMLFDDIELTVKETPSATKIPPIPVLYTVIPPCQCEGKNDPKKSSSKPVVKISKHYKKESDRIKLEKSMKKDLVSSSARMIPATVIAYSNDGAAIGGCGDARAAYLFVKKTGSLFGAKYLKKTEKLVAKASGQNTDTIKVEHKEGKNCKYEKVVGAAAIAILGSGAVVYDPLSGTEGGYRVLESLYDLASEFVEQEWITKVFDAIKDATTNYYVNVKANAQIDITVGRNKGQAKIETNAKLDRSGSEMKSDEKDLHDRDVSYALVSDCIKGDSMSLKLEGKNALEIEADDGGLGVMGQESLIGYVWYWACKTIEKGEDDTIIESLASDRRHFYKFTTYSEKDLADETINDRAKLTEKNIDNILKENIDSLSHEDMMDCNKVKAALEKSLKDWIKKYYKELNLYKSIAEDLK